MSFAIHGAPPEHLHWLVERVKYAPTKGLRALEAVDGTGRIVAMIGFDGWMDNSAEIHFACERPIALRSLARAAFRFIFEVADREYLYALAPTSRSQVIEWGRRIGFTEIHRLKDGCAKGDDLVYSVLHRDNCTWWRKSARKAA